MDDWEFEFMLSLIPSPGSGLESGGTSTQQSPAFKRITVDNAPTPSVFRYVGW